MPRILLYGNGVNLQFNDRLDAKKLFNQIIKSKRFREILNNDDIKYFSNTKLIPDYRNNKSWEKNLEDEFKNICEIYNNFYHLADREFLETSLLKIKNNFKKLVRKVIKKKL